MSTLKASLAWTALGLALTGGCSLIVAPDAGLIGSGGNGEGGSGGDASTTTTTSQGGGGGTTTTSQGGGGGTTTSGGGGQGGGTGGAGGAGGTGGGTTTSGGGGQGGGTGGAGGAGGSGGGGGGCGDPTECPQSTNECEFATCVGGVCGFDNVADNTPTVTQTVGDCQRTECDGTGSSSDVTDDTDLPVDNVPCTDDVCMNGVPTNPDTLINTVCGTGLVCNGMGDCIGCTTDAQCGTDDECKTFTCGVGGVCSTSFTLSGTALTTQTDGDCQTDVCDGAGNVTQDVDDTDLPIDGIACTDDVCTNGVATNPDTAINTACGTGDFCNGTGDCVDCNTDPQCGATTDCQSNTCVNNACVTANTNVGTPTTAQTPGNCQQIVCNGSGGTTSQADNADVPPSDGNACTLDTCSGGAPYPSAPINTGCGTGDFCNATGTCVDCNLDAQCPSTECSPQTCVTNTCTPNNVSNGTPLGTQTPGNCQLEVCNGTGGTTTQVDNTDVPPSDGNACTLDTCAAGVPYPSAPINTSCGTGDFCNATGTCVDCNVDLQCGTNTECRTFACSVSNTCSTTDVTLGTPLAVQAPGDCQEAVCDGSGSTTSQANNLDFPADDGNQCTLDTCVAGAPAHPAAPAGTACNQGGTVCNGAGACVAPLTIGFCRLQSPTAITSDPGTTQTVYGRVFVAGLTDQSALNNISPLLVAAVGYGPTGSAPSTWTNWTAAIPNAGYDGNTSGEVNNDEYQASLVTPGFAARDMGYRFSGDGGTTWTYCDADNEGSTDGFDLPGTITPALAPFFSEYIEGGSNNKALEIYNPTGSAFNLATNSCFIDLYSNGSATASSPFTLTGSIASGDVHVVAHSSAVAAVLAVADQTNNGGAMGFNGNDALALRCNSVILDVIGQTGFNPGTEWGTGLQSTSDNTLVRNCAILDGDELGTDAFTPATEWTGFATDTFTNLGSHTICP